jgi:hypothetical protein
MTKKSMYVSPSFFGAKVWTIAKFWEIFVTNLMILKQKLYIDKKYNT